MSRKRFRKAEVVKEAVQFTGNWHQLCEDLGWTRQHLVDEWPRHYAFWGHGGARIGVGDWVIVDGDKIVGLAMGEGLWDDYEEVA